MSTIDLKHINPGWHTGEEKYQINCINCAVATDAFLRGFMFEAKPTDRQRELEEIYNFYGDNFDESDDFKCSSLSEMLDQITFVTKRGFVIITPIQNLSDYDNSSKLKIRSRHIVNIGLIDNTTYVLDGQRNLVFESNNPPPSYLPDEAYYFCLSINSDDNSLFSDREKIENFCILPEKISP